MSVCSAICEKKSKRLYFSHGETLKTDDCYNVADLSLINLFVWFLRSWLSTDGCLENNNPIFDGFGPKSQKFLVFSTKLKK